MIAGAIWADQPMWLEFKKLQKLLDLLFAESADVIAIVDVPGGRPDHHKLAEHAGRLLRRQRADHAADGMPDENGILQAEFAADLDDVIGIAGRALEYFDLS